MKYIVKTVNPMAYFENAFDSYAEAHDFVKDHVEKLSNCVNIKDIKFLDLDTCIFKIIGAGHGMIMICEKNQVEIPGHKPEILSDWCYLDVVERL